MNSSSSDPNFDPALYPKCDQGPPPSPLDGDSTSAAKREFLAAYYRLNQSHWRLATVRGERRSAEEERTALQAIELALLARDAVEDKYAPLGIMATPEFTKGYVTNVSFGQPPRAARGASLSMVFAVQPGAPAGP
jgi:hypothetical protein